MKIENSKTWFWVWIIHLPLHFLFKHIPKNFVFICMLPIPSTMISFLSCESGHGPFSIYIHFSITLCVFLSQIKQFPFVLSYQQINYSCCTNYSYCIEDGESFFIGDVWTTFLSSYFVYVCSEKKNICRILFCSVVMTKWQPSSDIHILWLSSKLIARILWIPMKNFQLQWKHGSKIFKECPDPPG